VPLVYSLDRERRLRLVLRVALFAGVLLGLLTLFVLLTDRELWRDAVTAGSAGAAVLVASVVALRQLPARDRRARTAATLAGAVTLLIGFLFAATILGFAMIVIGLVVLLLARLRDDPELVT
jgi:tetrahydromethanopterin S-methyltransferase subunit F